MGNYLNPGNQGFEEIRKGLYVDKTGLIEYINNTINITPDRLTFFSRPRRFGKSFAAKMLCAYYDRSCDSRSLFEGLKISESRSFEENLNKYDVIYLDITWFISTTRNISHMVTDLQECVIRELRETFPVFVEEDEKSLPRVLLRISEKTGGKFIIIIDEWDALFREAKHDEILQKEYVQFLRGLFKGGSATDKMIAAAYMTGILPIKKYGTESALTDFQEFTMTDPLILSEYVGFTEKEVRMLCEKYHMDFDSIKKWYDGYSFEDRKSVYSPNSVVKAVKFRRLKSYWTLSETYESLRSYITKNFDGLKEAIVQMLGGQHVSVEISTFQNDITSFHNKNDILTLLIHLGYLAYHAAEKKAYIPNLEVAEAFRAAVTGTEWKQVNMALEQSEKLLQATIDGDSEMVASALELAHDSCASSLEYNDENSLACAILLAYYTAQNYYEIFRELPSGKGFADYAFIPRRDSDKPAMIIELKYNKSADSAINQIHNKCYAGKLKGFSGKVLLAGVNYSRETKGKKQKHHTCIIEKIAMNL